MSKFWKTGSLMGWLAFATELLRWLTEHLPK